MVTVTANQHTVLIIDDNYVSADRIRGYLEDARYNVHIAHSGEDVRQLMAQLTPDVIVLDVQLPVTNSLEVCQQIKQDETQGFVPIILTADTEAGLRLVGMRAGADDYLIKPIESRELLARIRALLSIKRRFDELLAANRRLADDLADRNRQLEQALKTAEELDIIKSAIVRNVSHELRTPLLQVKSAIALLDEEIAPDTPSSRIISMATQAVGRLESTVSSITQLAESQNLKLEPVALGESVDLAIRNLERSWKSHYDYSRIKKLYADDLPLARGDKRGIAQVLQILLDNALKFSPDGGPVEVILKPRPDGTIWIGVRDHGIGIPQDKLAHIFESFYQVESSSTRRFSGVGVGLTLASFILEKLGSSIQVESEPGQGSTFSFVLPQEHLASEPPPEKAVPEENIREAEPPKEHPPQDERPPEETSQDHLPPDEQP